MKNTITFLLAMAMCTSCKKDNTQINNSSILINHIWYPYMAEIITIDTTIVTIRDGTGASHTQSTVTNLDTTIILNTCLQDSRFRFKPNGVLNVSIPCNVRNSAVDTSWSILNDNFLTTVSINDTITDNYYSRFFSRFYGFSGPIDTTYSFSLTRGLITGIDNSQFIFNNIIVNLSFGITTVDRDTLNKITSKEYTTYKSQ